MVSGPTGAFNYSNVQYGSNIPAKDRTAIEKFMKENGLINTNIKSLAVDESGGQITFKFTLNKPQRNPEGGNEMTETTTTLFREQVIPPPPTPPPSLEGRARQ